MKTRPMRSVAAILLLAATPAFAAQATHHSYQKDNLAFMTQIGVVE